MMIFKPIHLVLASSFLMLSYALQAMSLSSQVVESLRTGFRYSKIERVQGEYQRVEVDETDQHLQDPTYQSPHKQRNIFHALCYASLSSVNTSLIFSRYSSEQIRRALNQHDYCGYTPLHCAIVQGDPYLVVLFLLWGADVRQLTYGINSKNVLSLAFDIRTPRSIAGSGFVQCVRKKIIISYLVFYLRQLGCLHHFKGQVMVGTNDKENHPYHEIIKFVEYLPSDLSSYGVYKIPWPLPEGGFYVYCSRCKGIQSNIEFSRVCQHCCGTFFNPHEQGEQVTVVTSTIFSKTGSPAPVVRPEGLKDMDILKILDDSRQGDA